MNRYIAAFIVAAIVGVSGCKTVRTSVHTDESADFARLRTYVWAEEGNPAGNDPRIDIDFLEPHIMSSFDIELARKGYKKVSKNASFTLGYSVAIAEKAVLYAKDKEEDRIVGGFSRKGRYDWKWTPDEDSGLDYYEEGTLCIRVVDPKDGGVLWGACASMPVELSAQDEKRKKLIRIIIRDLMTYFPE